MLMKKWAAEVRVPFLLVGENKAGYTSTQLMCGWTRVAIKLLGRGSNAKTAPKRQKS